MSILGLDIGGANIKGADEAGRTVSRPFAMWKRHEQLADEIASILAEFPQTERLAVTMTAELADCFATKSEGVRFILAAVVASAGSASVEVWTTAGRFLSASEAASRPMEVAAANWHALATWCGQMALSKREPGERKAPLTLTLSPTVFVPSKTGGGEGTRRKTREEEVAGLTLDSRPSALDAFPPSLLIDIGTTTTDITPLADGRPVARGLTDVGRLQMGELSYSGVKRTPVFALAHSVPFRDGYCPLAAELFATTLDVYLLLGGIAEDATDIETANGKPATKAAAYDRLARALCCDRDEISFDEAVQIARFLADVQRQRLAGSLERVAARFETPIETVIVSGSGSFLARRLIAENRRTTAARIVSLDDQLSPGIAEAACAYAVAKLLESALEDGHSCLS